jgi:hypothetical protein
MSSDQMVRVFVKYMDDHPDQITYAASIVGWFRARYREHWLAQR